MNKMNFTILIIALFFSAVNCASLCNTKIQYLNKVDYDGWYVNCMYKFTFAFFCVSKVNNPYHTCVRVKRVGTSAKIYIDEGDYADDVYVGRVDGMVEDISDYITLTEETYPNKGYLCALMFNFEDGRICPDTGVVEYIR